MNQPNRHSRRRQRKVDGTRDPDVMYPRMLRRAARVERDLRAEGTPSLEIPGILGAAFLASLTNLSLAEREEVLGAHLTAVDVMLQELLRAKQAPDGPMPDLGDIEP